MTDDEKNGVGGDGDVESSKHLLRAKDSTTFPKKNLQKAPVTWKLWQVLHPPPYPERLENRAKKFPTQPASLSRPPPPPPIFCRDASGEREGKQVLDGGAKKKFPSLPLSHRRQCGRCKTCAYNNKKKKKTGRYHEGSPMGGIRKVHAATSILGTTRGRRRRKMKKMHPPGLKPTISAKGGFPPGIKFNILSKLSQLARCKDVAFGESHFLCASANASVRTNSLFLLSPYIKQRLRETNTTSHPKSVTFAKFSLAARMTLTCDFPLIPSFSKSESK